MRAEIQGPAGDVASDHGFHRLPPRFRLPVLDERFATANDAAIRPIAEDPPRFRLERTERARPQPDELRVLLVDVALAHARSDRRAIGTVVVEESEQLEAMARGQLPRQLGEDAQMVLLVGGQSALVGALGGQLPPRRQRRAERVVGSALPLEPHGVEFGVPPPQPIVFEIEVAEIEVDAASEQVFREHPHLAALHVPVVGAVRRLRREIAIPVQGPLHEECERFAEGVEELDLELVLEQHPIVSVGVDAGQDRIGRLELRSRTPRWR